MGTLISLVEAYQALINQAYVRKSQVDFLSAKGQTRTGGELDPSSSMAIFSQVHIGINCLSFADVLAPNFSQSIAQQLVRLPQAELSELEDLYLLARNQFSQVDVSSHASLLLPRKEFPKFNFTYMKKSATYRVADSIPQHAYTQAAEEIKAVFDNIPLLGFVYLTTFTHPYLLGVGESDTP